MFNKDEEVADIVRGASFKRETTDREVYTRVLDEVKSSKKERRPSKKSDPMDIIFERVDGPIIPTTDGKEPPVYYIEGFVRIRFRPG